MAGAALSSPSLLPRFPKLHCSYSSPSTKLPFIHQTFFPLSPHNNKTGRTRNPRTTICYGKLKGGEELPEEIEEGFLDGDDEIADDSEEDEETESSMDLLFRFLQSMFKKVSKRAKKATRSILPPLISPQLVSFGVDGVLLLTLLSIIKALLEVVCTLGGTVFVVILLLRVIWATVSHFQSSGNSFINQGGTYYGTT